MATYQERSGSCRAIVRVRGHKPETRTFDTRAEAEAWAGPREAELRGEITSAAFPELQPGTYPTLAKAIEKYIAERAPAFRGHKQQTVRLRRWQRHPLAAKRLDRVTPKDLRRERDAQLDRGLAGGTVRSNFAALSVVFEEARTEWEFYGLDNPKRRIRMPPPGGGRERRLRKGEEKRLLEHARPMLRELITLALETAMRRGEIHTLEWDRIDLKRRVIHLDKTKNGDARGVPLSSRAVAALEALGPKDEGPVFPWASPDVITHYFSDLCATLGIEGLTFHDLRHEATSRLCESGRFDSIMEVMAITGHKSWEMVKRYTHLFADRLAKKLA